MLSIREPEIAGIDVDSVEFLDRQRTILNRKTVFKRIFEDFYRSILVADQKHLTATGKRLEIGAGTSFIQETIPGVIRTDIKPDPKVDQVLDATNMNLETGSMRTLIGINCFHHFPDVEKFFQESARVLAPGGGIILIEPYYGVFGSFLYKRLFATETFDKTQKDWQTSQSSMTGANQALSYVVFIRDRELFEKKFPQFEIVEMKPLSNAMRYLLSGGLNFRQLLPSFLFGFVSAVEKLLYPVVYLWGLHYQIVIRKK